jgi:DNA-binding transcriptional LysR family regulator
MKEWIRGIARLFWHQVADEVRGGKLEVVLEGEEYPPLPVHLISPSARPSMPKVRAFMDFAVPRLRTTSRVSPKLQAMSPKPSFTIT